MTDLVKDYVAFNIILNKICHLICHKINTLSQVCFLLTPFKENRPGKEWLRNFMKRNKLNTKKANMISYARMVNTSNPFVVYNLFETIEKIANENNFSPSQVWNCDETGFPTDGGQCKVVAPKGKQPNKKPRGAGEGGKHFCASHMSC